MKKAQASWVPITLADFFLGCAVLKIWRKKIIKNVCISCEELFIAGFGQCLEKNESKENGE